MAVVQPLKRGHHSDFALSQEEVADLIEYCSDRRTKAMVILASLGVPVRGIVSFKASHHVMLRGPADPVLDITGVTADPIPLTPKQYQLLSTFRDGFQVTNVTIWRKIKRVIVAAGKDGVLTFDPERVPYPAALSYQPVETMLSSTQMVRWCLERIHTMQTRLPNAEFGTVDHCPHKDCERIRKWLSRRSADS